MVIVMTNAQVAALAASIRLSGNTGARGGQWDKWFDYILSRLEEH